MGDWLSILLLIFVGIILIYIEILLVPGTTIVGLVGLAFCVAGIYLTYENHGATTGNWFLAGTSIVSLGGLIYGFRSNSWQKFSLKTTNTSKFNEGYYVGLEVGMKGVATSDLKPIGKAEFNDKIYEVRSKGEHIPSGTSIKIAKVNGSKIIIETTTTD